jgi:hypothetical protein
METADRASTRLDFDSIEPSSFHLDPRFGTRSRDIRATCRWVPPASSKTHRRSPLSAASPPSASLAALTKAMDAANITAARTCAAVSVGNPRKISASLAPSAKLARTLRTGTRVPRKTSAPPATAALCSKCSSNATITNNYHSSGVPASPGRPAEHGSTAGRLRAGRRVDPARQAACGGAGKSATGCQHPGNSQPGSEGGDLAYCVDCVGADNGSNPECSACERLQATTTRQGTRCQPRVRV